MAARRGKWHPPPVPTPRIIHLPRRSRLSRPPKVAAKAPPTRSPLVSGRNQLGALFDEERSFSGGYSERRARVAASSSGESGGDSGEERWRFQAEILRAECNFLRMEREVALRKLEKNRAQMEATLRSAMETLVSGRKKIDGSEINVGGAALEEEIEELEDKLEELQVERSTGTRRAGSESFRDLQRSNARNFDRQASVLRRRLEKMADETSVREIREIAATEEEKQYSDHHCRFPDVEMLKRRMEGLSKGMLERMEEYGCLLSANSSSCSHSTTTTSSRDSTRRCASGRRVIECTGMAEKAHNHYQHQQQQQQQVAGEKEWAVMGSSTGNCCNCKVVVGRIMEQVRAEIEQWSEMQGMLEQVRLEMEELQSSRDLWQHRAITSDINIHSIQTQMLEWKRITARASEHKVTELEKEVSELQMKLQYSTRAADQLLNPPISSARTRSERRNQDVRRIKNQQQRLLDLHREKEKHVLVCRLKKNPHSNFPRRLPLQDIGNNLREK